MREIKFRAWNTESKEMILLENSGLQYFDFEGNYSLGFTVDGYSGFWAHEQYDKASEEAHKFPIMQYTGLKDKNGKDIYEGDILNHPNSGNFEVRFQDYGFKLVYYGVVQQSHTTEHMEIIGNIHENPELL